MVQGGHRVFFCKKTFSDVKKTILDDHFLEVLKKTIFGVICPPRWTGVVFWQNEKNGWGKSSNKSNASKILKKKRRESGQRCYSSFGSKMGQN